MITRWRSGELAVWTCERLLSLTYTTTVERTVTRADCEDALHALLNTLTHGQRIRTEWRGSDWTITYDGPVEVDDRLVMQPLHQLGVRDRSGDLGPGLHSVTAFETVEQKWERGNE